MNCSSIAKSGNLWGKTTQLPPFSSGAQSSNVEASKDVGAINKEALKRVELRVLLPPRTSRTTARCGMATPLGRPVDPDVYIMYARLCELPEIPGFSTSIGLDDSGVLTRIENFDARFLQAGWQWMFGEYDFGAAVL